MLDNINSIQKSAEITLSKRAFTLRESPKHRNFTEKVTCKIGDLILSNFFGIDIELKARIKAPESIRAKVKRQSLAYAKEQVSTSEDILDINDFGLFDVYGAKVVVLSVSDSFFSKHLCIDGFLEKRKKSRKLCEIADDILAKNPTSEDKIEIARLNRVIYHELDTMCQRYVADAICTFILSNKELSDNFGLYNVAHRFRNYNSKNEYIAKHITLGSTLLPGWYMELQFKSFSDYEVARIGEAAHSDRKGKKIVIPNSLSDVDWDTVQSYLFYTPDGLYIPSKKECLFYKLISACPEESKKLLDLFKDFSDLDSGHFKV